MRGGLQIAALGATKAVASPAYADSSQSVSSQAYGSDSLGSSPMSAGDALSPTHSFGMKTLVGVACIVGLAVIYWSLPE